jgi:tyrosine-protein kinase Etk/Wzc
MTEQETPLLSQFSKAEPEPLQTPDAETSVVDILVVLLRRKKLIGWSTLAVTLLGALLVFFLPPSYVAEATIMPPQQQQSSMAALAGAMGGLAGGGGASQLGLKSPSDIYIGILKSRTIADDIISRFHLKDVYRTKFLSDARKTLSRNATFVSGKDTLIMIAVKDRDAQRAADIANAYMDELHNQNSRLALTDASQRRLFYGEQLKEEKDALANAEIAMKATQQSTGILAPAGQSEALIKTGAEFRAEIASREVQLQAMRSYATEENPQIQVLKREIAAMQGQLKQVEANGSGSKLEMSGGRMPAATLEYIRRVRDLKYHETLFELLAKQYEAARIDEAKQAPVIQVVDRAIIPDKDSRPRKLLVAGATCFGLLFSCLFVLGINRMQSLIVLARAH